VKTAVAAGFSLLVILALLWTQATLLWLVFWLFALRVVAFVLITLRERRANACVEVEADSVLERLNTSQGDH